MVNQKFDNINLIYVPNINLSGKKKKKVDMTFLTEFAYCFARTVI